MLLVIGCDSEDHPPSPTDTVSILTAVDPTVAGGRTIGCYDLTWTGLLKADPKWGTTITFDVASAGVGTVPVMWLPGFTGHRIGSEVAVYDAKNNFVATTGHRYTLMGGSDAPIPAKLDDADVPPDTRSLLTCHVLPPVTP